MNVERAAEEYRQLLLTNLLPWWLNHAIDRECGGICTCIADDGVIVSYDKYVWSQVRALWTFSGAYNRVTADPVFRATADQLFAFVSKIEGAERGEWPFLVSRDGQIKEGPDSIQTDAFAICALVEYAKATGHQQAIELAKQTYRCTLGKLRRPGSYPTRPYPIPEGTKAQRVSMQFSLAYWELGKFLDDPAITAEAMALTDDVLDHFRQPQQQVIVEYLSLDNKMLEPPIGTFVGPGHGIETAWFQIENIRHTGDFQRLDKALEIMRWSFEIGWDQAYGGLFLGVDLSGGTPYLPHAEKKLFWPHSEALCGALMGYELCGEDWCLNWYNKVHDWAFKHFPDREHGEWHQRLDRSGQVIDEVIALPVKDPFHLPRAVIYAIEVLQRLARKGRESGAHSPSGA